MYRHFTHSFTPLLAAALLCLTACTWIFPDTSCADPQTITIHYDERPPYYITENGKLGGIIGERVRQVFEKARVPHRFSVTPPKRQLLLLKHNEGRDCIVGWFHTPERARIANFSRPIYRDLPQMILTRKENPLLDRFETLPELLADRSPSLLLREGHSYGTDLDILMARLVPRIIITSASNDSMVRMIHAGRADYMFISSSEAQDIIKEAGVTASDLTLRTLAGTPRGNKRYLLFSKKIERTIIARINEAISSIEATKPE